MDGSVGQMNKLNLLGSFEVEHMNDPLGETGWTAMHCLMQMGEEKIMAEKRGESTKVKQSGVRNAY